MPSVRSLIVALLIAAVPVGVRGETALIDIAYGPDPKQKLDLYLPEGQGPLPVLVAIHGGGWVSGDKAHMAGEPLRKIAHEAGCAYASLNYRFIAEAKRDGIYPPVMGPYSDCLRALQHLRLHAEQWRLNKDRVGLYGGSAGACTSLWLALHSEQADPESDEPLARQSSRVMVAGVVGAQTSLDPRQMREWVGDGLTYGGHAYGFKGFRQFLQGRDQIAKLIPHVSPAALLSPDDPPIYLFYGAGLEPEAGKKPDDTHSPRFGIGFAQLAEQQGVECHLSYRGHGTIQSRTDLVRQVVEVIREPRSP